jgi:hypothetical protein
MLRCNRVSWNTFIKLDTAIVVRNYAKNGLTRTRGDTNRLIGWYEERDGVTGHESLKGALYEIRRVAVTSEDNWEAYVQSGPDQSSFADALEQKWKDDTEWAAKGLTFKFVMALRPHKEVSELTTPHDERTINWGADRIVY